MWTQTHGLINMDNLFVHRFIRMQGKNVSWEMLHGWSSVVRNRKASLNTHTRPKKRESIGILYIYHILTQTAAKWYSAPNTASDRDGNKTNSYSAMSGKFVLAVDDVAEIAIATATAPPRLQQQTQLQLTVKKITFASFPIFFFARMLSYRVQNWALYSQCT